MGKAAHIIANEMGANLRHTSCSVLEKPGDLAAADQLEPNDVLFVDEIHRLSPVVEGVESRSGAGRFPAWIMIGEGPAARSIKLDLPPFTLVGAEPQVC